MATEDFSIEILEYRSIDSETQETSVSLAHLSTIPYHTGGTTAAAETTTTTSSAQSGVIAAVSKGASAQPIPKPRKKKPELVYSQAYISREGRMSQIDVDGLRETPWRKTVNWNNSFETLAELKDDCENYEPLGELLTGEVHFPQVNILLFGGVGAGKSSVFNTINSCFRGKIFNVARSGCAEHSLTSKFTKYPIMSGSSTLPLPLKFRICDIRGLEVDHLMNKENMRYILEGNIADRYPLDPCGNISSDMPGFKKNPGLDDKIHCVAIVQDATIVDAMQDLSPEVTKNIKDMQTVMNSLDIPQVVILSKVDSICEATKDDPANAFRSQKVEKCVAKVSEVLGLPRNMVFPMKNYEAEYQLDPSIDIMSLLTLKGILNNCDAHLFYHYDEIVERYAVTQR
ncbi:interferon-induced protein 44-like isoform X1 [Ruditapes philippinarum]|uniref:interferon-induced protein 44-like isoform X1 n=1 Tax=Ruditapes philippinarum TaxID=129788 RepID=UPI00295A5BD5|nr:interferon-induced protein 44-like isoform X1 [Ruditapes philippinarum]